MYYLWTYLDRVDWTKIFSFSFFIGDRKLQGTKIHQNFLKYFNYV